MKTEDLKQGEVYFIDYDGACKIIMRFKKDETTHCEFYSYLKLWNDACTFYENGYGVHSGMTELRAATQSETAKLEKYEAENGVECKGKEPTKLKPEDLKKGKVYFIQFESKNQLIGRFNKMRGSTDIIFYSCFNTSIGIFNKGGYADYDTITELRSAKPKEKAKLKKCELKRKIQDLKEQVEVLELESMGQDMVLDELTTTIEIQAQVFAKTTNTKNDLEKRLDKQIIKGQSDFKSAWDRYKAEQLKVEKMKEYLTIQKGMQEDGNEYHHIYHCCLNALEAIDKPNA